MLIDNNASPVLATLTDKDRRVAMLHAELHACRLALIRGVAQYPDDADDREALWVHYYQLRRDVESTLIAVEDTVRAIIAADEQPGLFAKPARDGVKFPVEHDGATEWRPSWLMFPQLDELERPVSMVELVAQQAAAG